LLDYYRACGVDCALEEAPRDRFADSARRVVEAPANVSAPPSEPKARVEKPRAVAAAIFPDEAVRAAERLAASAKTLGELRDALENFDGCGPLSNAKNFLFSAGAPGGLMALDYAPGEAEERGGEPFSGDEARLLDAMMAAIGENRETAYYAYFSPWRPAGGQKLAPHVAAALAPFARRHVELAKPKALLLLGDETTKIMLGVNEPAPRLYARRFDVHFGGESVAVFPAPGLSAMLRTNALKRAAWRALRALAPDYAR
ncbi:MAG: uracil-DNA glycosylase family protein, partial [Methylocystis sp.]